MYKLVFFMYDFLYNDKHRKIEYGNAWKIILIILLKKNMTE